MVFRSEAKPNNLQMMGYNRCNGSLHWYRDIAAYEIIMRECVENAEKLKVQILEDAAKASIINVFAGLALSVVSLAVRNSAVGINLQELPGREAHSA
ncbi:hypothetical protein MGYG_00705 [Nannizzia gypsea CBS 118893]|uniref:Uncharacterized protein n=1 Tax=Arthroderma gypseum (strain ATCC MYA-4604 / CBS 118893) TaxID=535722 RepID=E5R1B4_ARTGP|nr:hypothetical protein MGYG_00705 [Nannizzia gypsea CBS 118893]EFQ97665.1 hypothetical protein MGYG_00705 [Nannizzia gypsea CBS 118893]